MGLKRLNATKSEIISVMIMVFITFFQYNQIQNFENSMFA